VSGAAIGYFDTEKKTYLQLREAEQPVRRRPGVLNGG
jgi:hypothetical protein